MILAGRLPPFRRLETAVLIRATRSALRMSQKQLALRSGLTRVYLTRLEAGSIDAKTGTLRRVFSSLFCDLLILPLPRRRLGDALAERDLEREKLFFPPRGIWD